MELTFMAKTDEGYLFMSPDDYSLCVLAAEDLKEVALLREGCLYRIEPGVSCELIGWPSHPPVAGQAAIVTVQVEVSIQRPDEPDEPVPPTD